MINRYDVNHMEGFLYNQMEAILSQYELEIRQISKGRGCLICETDKGTKLLCPFKGSEEKGEWLRQYLKALEKNGYEAEQIVVSKEGKTVVEDGMTGERFWLKDAKKGMELNTAHMGEVIEAAGELARFHNASAATGLEDGAISRFDVQKGCERHARELVKVKNYIRTRKKKQEFEQMYLRYFESMHETAEKSCRLLQRAAQKDSDCILCHGDCNQHNLLWGNGKWQMIHFENVAAGWAMWDLANYVRKMMEKNGWNEELGVAILQEYHKYRPISGEDYQKLCGLLLFPEKFWKVANHYMSSSKVWIPEKDIEKLKKVIEQEIHRLKFVENLFSFRP